jgi:hypothetical protein
VYFSMSCGCGGGAGERRMGRLCDHVALAAGVWPMWRERTQRQADVCWEDRSGSSGGGDLEDITGGWVKSGWTFMWSQEAELASSVKLECGSAACSGPAWALPSSSFLIPTTVGA